MGTPKADGNLEPKNPSHLARDAMFVGVGMVAAGQAMKHAAHKRLQGDPQALAAYDKAYKKGQWYGVIIVLVLIAIAVTVIVVVMSWANSQPASGQDLPRAVFSATSSVLYRS